MTNIQTRTIDINGFPCRIWEKGEGPMIGYLGGLRGVPNWTPFLEKLSETHRVVVPSLPGFSGAMGHDALDDTLDWVSATLDLLEGANLIGQDLIGAGIGGMMAAEVAALSPSAVKRLVLMAPFGLFDEQNPVENIWAKTEGELDELFGEDLPEISRLLAKPEGEEPGEWRILQARNAAATARLMWPTGDLGLSKRLHRIKIPTMVMWGQADKIIPVGYLDKFAKAIPGIRNQSIIEGAGHLVDLDKPNAVAVEVEEFLGRYQ